MDLSLSQSLPDSVSGARTLRIRPVAEQTGTCPRRSARNQPEGPFAVLLAAGAGGPVQGFALGSVRMSAQGHTAEFRADLPQVKIGSTVPGFAN